ncbi:MAG: GNAT family N-acetyltransferase [Solirubrobacteraceae bacterium]
MACVSIRTAALEDLPALRRVFRRASLSNEGDREALLANPAALELSDGNVIEGKTRIAMSSDGTVVGFATGIPHVDSALELEDLFVDPGHRRQGISRTLLADLAASALNDGITHIEVTANPHAEDFYREVGFVAVGHAGTEFGAGTRMRLDDLRYPVNSRPSADSGWER